MVHRYEGPGTYRATLRVSDASGQVGAGAERDFEVFVKRPPTAVAGDDLVVAPGEMRDFRRRALARRRTADRPLSLGFLRRRAGRGAEREPQLRAARPLHRDPAGRGRYARRPATSRSISRSSRSMPRRSRSPATTGGSRSARRSSWKAAAATMSTARSSSTCGISATAPRSPSRPAATLTARPAPTASP